MNKPAQTATQTQLQPPLTPTQELEQAASQRVIRAIQGGLQYLLDTDVIGPMKHADGVADLKWLLRKLMVGEYGVNMKPGRTRAPAAQPLRKASIAGLEDSDGEGSDFPTIPAGSTKQ